MRDWLSSWTDTISPRGHNHLSHNNVSRSHFRVARDSYLLQGSFPHIRCSCWGSTLTASRKFTVPILSGTSPSSGDAWHRAWIGLEIWKRIAICICHYFSWLIYSIIRSSLSDYVLHLHLQCKLWILNLSCPWAQPYHSRQDSVLQINHMKYIIR